MRKWHWPVIIISLLLWGAGYAWTHFAATLVTTRLTGVMGTDAHIQAERAILDRHGAEIDFAIRAVETRMSSWIDQSEIGLINAAAAPHTVRLSPETARVLTAAKEISRITGGYFDVTCGPLISSWRTAAATGVRPTAEALTQARTISGWQAWQFTDGLLTKLHTGSRIDLGAIAKGYAIDQGISALQQRGARQGLIEIGGDLRCFGPEPWTIAIADPSGSGIWGQLRVTDRAVATSGPYRRGFTIDGTTYSHIIDPTTGRPTEGGYRSVTVIAPTAMAADAWATALSVLPSKGIQVLPHGIDALVITPTGSERTAGFKKWLTSE